MEIATKYNPAEVEDKWYKYWMDNQFFHSEPDEREPYTIVIPPPNVTGILHMGHMLNNTIQDILVRRARMQGKNACWVPGTDHASIATEAKVVAKLAAEGIQKSDLTREQFLEHAWEWTHKHGGIILEQLKKLGASCDWERTAFTMDKERSESVIRVFVDLYNKGLIYRGVRMVNWDTQAQTALSDEEVIHKEVNGKLYYLRYKVSPPTPQRGDSRKPGYQTSRSASYALLKQNAKEMRRFSTDAERILWEMLRGKNLGDKFRRQHIIDDFIVDFVCLSKNLIVEVDGAYHNTSDMIEADNLRTEILESQGYHILRFSNEEVIADTANVLRKIEDTLLLPYGGRLGGGLEVEGAEEYAIIATTRPETIFGDVAVCINPNDPKNQHLRGKTLIVPIANREVPVIEDEYVDIEFGTGCLKVTPAHDINDYMLGDKYNLESIDIFNNDGTLNAHGLHYEGVDRFEVRKRIEKELEENDLLEKTEPYTNNVGFSERTDAVIEPKLSMQWFLKMGDIAKPALDAVMNDTIQLHPEKFKNTYRHWMENIRDWNISRQLWWGHRIPAYYLPEGGFVVAASDEKALELARERNPQLTMNDLQQDEDCLDTWFSSWLWPISVFDGINHPENKDIQYYYPTNDLVTAPEILFFWVARMIIAGYEYTGKPCFNNVYLTGIVRDKLGRKMSKSLGNSPDPIELMQKYGADGVRMGMLLASAAGNDLPFDESLCEQGRNFNNKIWNAFRLVKGWSLSPAPAKEGGEALSNSPHRGEQPDAAKIAVKWFDAILNKTIAEMNDLFSKYRLSEALMLLYKLFWDEFSSWYLEIIKPAYQQPIDKKTHDATLTFFDALLRLLHPFMPFITEELWQALAERKPGDSIMVSRQPSPLAPQREDAQAELIKQFEEMKQIIAGIRTIRLQKNIPNKESLRLQIIGPHVADYDTVISKICNLESIENMTEKSGNSVAFMVGTTEYAVPMGSLINAEEEIEKMQAEIGYLEGFLQSVQKKLSNERFVQNAKPEVVDNERKKLADAESKIAALKENIATLSAQRL